MEKSVFMIITQCKNYNYKAPWQSSVNVGHGTGFCMNIQGVKYILTNEHVIDNNISIFINENPVKVLYRDKISDIAILNCPDELQAEPLELSQVKVGETVHAYGFPLNFGGINITKGTVTRFITVNLNISKYIHMQVSSVTNPGNSGGPLIYKGKICGILRAGNQYYNTFLAIPFYVIDFHINCFIKDLYPKIFDFSWQNINELMYMLPEFKQFKDNGSKGLLINNKHYVTHIEGIKIHEKGKIKLTDMLNYFGFNFSESDIDSSYAFNFKYLVGLLYNNKVTFSNEITKKKIEFKLNNFKIEFNKPIIYIFGGWVFSCITYAYNTYRQANYPIGKVVILEIIENEMNYEFANFKGVILDTEWNDFIKIFKNLKNTKPIILPSYYDKFCVYINPLESKFTEKTIQILFGL